MTETIQPKTPEDIQEAIRWAVSSGNPLEVTGGGSKSAFGRPVAAGHRLDVSALAGVGLYEPRELVMDAAAATPLADITAALAEHRQQLFFEPPDLGPLLGGPAGAGTIGGVIACNLAGPRRPMAGAARDHILGFHAVSGRGDVFKSGGRVIKNVTGFDLSKLMTGSFGTLAVMTEIAVKVMPAAEETATVLLAAAHVEGAVDAMAAAMQSPYEVSGAAHLTSQATPSSAVQRVSGGGALTALRLEGPGPSVEYRTDAVRALLAEFGDMEVLETAESLTLWQEIRDVACFVGETDRPVWRISLPPADAAYVAGRLEGHVLFDWAGGLIWLSAPPSADAGHEAVRAAIAECGGHATLVRAAESVRAAVPVFQPQPPALAALAERVKTSFDPDGVLNPGRMVDGV